MNYPLKYKTIIFLCFIVYGFTQDFTKVAKLTSGSLNDFVNTHEYVFLKIYKPDNCYFCEMLAFEFEHAAQILSKNNIFFAEIDGTKDEELKERFQLVVYGYPSLKFFIHGHMMEYTGNRGFNAMIDWITTKIKIATVSTDIPLEKLIREQDIVVVHFGGNKNDEFNNFEVVAKQFEDIFFVSYGDIPTYKKYQPNHQVMLFKNFDEKQIHYPKLVTSIDEFAQWIDYHQFQIVENITYKSLEKIIANKKPLLVLFHDKKQVSTTARKQLKKAAEILRGKIVVAESQIEEGMGERFAEYMNVTTDMLPTVRIHWITDTEVRRYIYEGDLNSDGIVTFYENWKKGELKAIYKSESIPEDNDRLLVKKVVSLNFDQIVRDTTKNVFLVITVPWCGQTCQQVLDIFDELAQAKNHELKDVIFATMDATLNEVEGLIIEGFPCLKFYPKLKKFDNINYRDEITMKGFLTFLQGDNYIPESPKMEEL